MTHIPLYIKGYHFSTLAIKTYFQDSKSDAFEYLSKMFLFMTSLNAIQVVNQSSCLLNCHRMTWKGIHSHCVDFLDQYTFLEQQVTQNCPIKLFTSQNAKFYSVQSRLIITEIWTQCKACQGLCIGGSRGACQGLCIGGSRGRVWHTPPP